jgi:hypothetical protein
VEIFFAVRSGKKRIVVVERLRNPITLRRSRFRDR